MNELMRLISIMRGFVFPEYVRIYCHIVNVYNLWTWIVRPLQIRSYAARKKCTSANGIRYESGVVFQANMMEMFGYLWKKRAKNYDHFDLLSYCGTRSRIFSYFWRVLRRLIEMIYAFCHDKHVKFLVEWICIWPTQLLVVFIVVKNLNQKISIYLWFYCLFLTSANERNL